MIGAQSSHSSNEENDLVLLDMYIVKKLQHVARKIRTSRKHSSSSLPSKMNQIL